MAWFEKYVYPFFRPGEKSKCRRVYKRGAGSRCANVDVWGFWKCDALDVHVIRQVPRHCPSICAFRLEIVRPLASPPQGLRVVLGRVEGHKRPVLQE